MKKSIVMFFLCVYGVGCAALNIQKPTATVTGMTVQNVNASGFTMNFGVDLKNPNAMTLPLTAGDYKIGLAGTNVASGKVDPQGSIPANGTKSLVVPVTLTYENLLGAEKAIVSGGGNVPYSLDGDLTLNSGTPIIGNVSVPLQSSGTLAVKDILKDPQAVMQNPAAQKLAKDLLGGFFSP